MALKATIFKADLQVSDMDRHYYGQHSLTLARHPSETDERLMMRVLAFALYASESLSFGRGLSTEDEADLYDQDLTGRITHWIDVGTPDERDIRKACARAERVTLLAYGRTALTWWEQNRKVLERLDHLAVLYLPPETSQAMAQLCNRNMQIQCTIEDGMIWLSSGDTTSDCSLETLKPAT